MIGERTIKRQSYGSVTRNRLVDVTNSPARPGFGRESKSLRVSSTSDNYANRLLQENTALARVLEERNKVIELNAAELQKLRAINQKMQMQNLSLAQSNSRILAELKLGREKMKMLQHELVCKETLLKAKELEIQQKAEVNISEIVPPEVATDPDDAAKSYDRVRKRATKSQSMVPVNSKNQPKRQCVRRHSFGLQEQEEAIVCTQRVSERSSVGRPSRSAADKVRSYREAPLNRKMRRSS